MFYSYTILEMDAEQDIEWVAVECEVNDHLLERYEEDEDAVYFLIQESVSEDDGRSEESESKVYFINHTTVNDANAQSYSASNDELEMSTLKDQICTILNPDERLLNQKIIDDLSFFFKSNDFLTDVDGFWKTIQWPRIETIIDTLIKKSDNAEQNMACLSGCLVRVFCILADQQPPVAPDDLKSKLTVFLKAIGRIVKDFDRDAWVTWFRCNNKFADWVFFTASVFMPDGDVYVGKGESNRIKNALQFLGKILHRRRIIPSDESTKSPSPEIPEAVDGGASTSGPKRKFEETGNGNGEEEENEEQQHTQRTKRTKTD